MVKGFIALVVVVLTVWTVCFTVDETQYAIVTRFGDPVRVIEEPGFRVKWPAPIESVVYFDRRLLVLGIPGPDDPVREFLTEDKKNVEVSSYTCWRISDPLHYFKALGNRERAETMLGVIVASELGKVLGNYELSALLSTKVEELKLEPVMDEIREACVKMADREYGIKIVDFRIKRINFPKQNRNSVFERMRAERKRIATLYRSEGEEEATKIRARASKLCTETIAKASREAREIEGRAEAEATSIYAEAYGQDPEFYEFLRTLESYETSLTKDTTLVLPADSPYLKLLIMQGAALPDGESQQPVTAPPYDRVSEQGELPSDAENVDDDRQPTE